MITANAVLLTNNDIDLSAHGIDTVSIESAEAYLQDSNPSVLGAHCQPQTYQQVLSLFSKEKAKNPSKRFIIIQDQLEASELIEINNKIHPTRITPLVDDAHLVELFEQSFDRYYQLEQVKDLTSLVHQKNDELKRLMLSLEEKVGERQAQLEKSRNKNLKAEKHLTTLKKTLVHIYQASSINEIEHGIASSLKDDFKISWVSIRSPGQSSLSDKKKDLKFFAVNLTSGKRDFGQMIFFKQKNGAFDAKEKRFLGQVADAVSLSIERTIQYQKSQELKRQWEATFDAISDPICLTDDNYNILRINAAFLKKTQSTDYRKHLGQKCYKSLFGRSKPCEGCTKGEFFQIRNPYQNKQSEVFDVYSNNLSQKDQRVYLQMYRDVTQDLNLQRQVIESAKMAELGTISSSIAHELNNPIGGMLNFIQLMKMDLTGQEDYFPDLLEIEKGIIKCKNIVKNLLGFSRKSFHADVGEVSLKEVIEQAIKITELKTRSIGISIDFDSTSDDVIINGRFNLLTHAVRNLLQNCQESLVDRRKKDKTFQGKIEILLTENKKAIELDIRDNGDGIIETEKHKIFDPLYTTKDLKTNSGLGLTLALQIVEEHNGTIIVSTSKDKKLSMKLRFSKSEVQSGPSDFWPQKIDTVKMFS